MSDKPARPFLQIHLSTAMVLMFAACGLLWLNVPKPIDKEMTNPDSQGRSFLCIDDRGGWPWMMFRRWRHADPADDAIHIFPPQPPVWYPMDIAKNSAVAAAILCAIGFICERLTRTVFRSREARKP